VAAIGGIEIELPIVQAGMGGGLSRHELAAAVSAAGGLGTLGMMPGQAVERELLRVRERTVNPVAVNVLLPFARRSHFEAAERADVVVTFWGRPVRRTGRVWIHQVGSVEEAEAAARAGADAVIAQGVEAGGHVRGTVPAIELLERVRAALPPGYPVLSAGNVADAADVQERLDAGAAAAVLGTRFLMSDESHAHAAYKQRLMEGRETVLTELFGSGWPSAHRVLWNEATERWLRADPRGPRLVRVLNNLSAPLLARAPDRVRMAFVTRQRAGVPFFSPQPPTDASPSRMLDVAPLYAGETVARIHDTKPAATIVRELLPPGYVSTSGVRNAL
jgi:nitronate monooxygenase